MGKRNELGLNNTSQQNQSNTAPTIHAPGVIDEPMQPGDVHAGDELQEIDFDVDMMMAEDTDAVFHLMQRWCPLRWNYSVDNLMSALTSTNLTSLVKIPDDNNGEDLQLLNDNGEQVYGIVSSLNIASLIRQNENQPFFSNLCSPANADDLSKKDISTLLDPAHLAMHPVCLVVNERMVNLPPELGAQLHVNLFEELASGSSGENPQYEYFIILAKVRMNADKEVEEMEVQMSDASQQQQQQQQQQQNSSSSKRRKKDPQQEEDQNPISDSKCLFLRPEEIFYYRCHDKNFSMKWFVLEEEVSKDVVIVPFVVHKSKIEELVGGIKTLDTFFME